MDFPTFKNQFDSLCCPAFMLKWTIFPGSPLCIKNLSKKNQHATVFGPISCIKGWPRKVPLTIQSQTFEKHTSISLSSTWPPTWNLHSFCLSFLLFKNKFKVLEEVKDVEDILIVIQVFIAVEFWEGVGNVAETSIVKREKSASKWKWYWHEISYLNSRIFFSFF